MSSFLSDCAALACVHAELLRVVAETDVERLTPLVARRGDLLASLAVAFAAASSQEKETWREAIAQLAAADRELTAGFTRVRDQLAAELARASSRTGASPPEPTSGGVNLRA